MGMAISGGPGGPGGLGSVAGTGGAGGAQDPQKLMELIKKLLEALQLRGNHAKGGGKALALRVDVDSEACEAGNRVREVELAVDLEALLLLARDDPVEELPGRVRTQLGEGFEPLQLAAYTQRRVRADGHVQIGRVVRDHLLEQGVN